MTKTDDDAASADNEYEQKIKEMNKAIKQQIRTTDPNEDEPPRDHRFDQ